LLRFFPQFSPYECLRTNKIFKVSLIFSLR
jgi:hypothetical protein